MAGFPVAFNYNQIPNQAFIPEIWSTNMLARYYEETLTPQLVNTDYEPEIKNYGDTVHIRRKPEITLYDYSIGVNLQRQVVLDEQIEFLIDKGSYWNVPVDDVQKRQSDVRWVEALEENAVTQQKRYVDQQVFGSIYADVDANNVLASAAVSANSWPVVLSDMMVKLDEGFCPMEGRWLLVPYWAGGQIMLNPTFVSAEKMGDSKSMIRAGSFGNLYNFKIFRTPNLPTVGGYLQLEFGAPTAVTFGTQFQKPETLRNPDAFGDLVRGIQIFGFKTVQNKHLGKKGVTQAA